MSLFDTAPTYSPAILGASSLSGQGMIPHLALFREGKANEGGDDFKYARRDLNLQPSASEADALSN